MLFEYDEIPRGRVLFDKAKARYVVYLDRTLFNRTTQQAVLNACLARGADCVSYRLELHDTQAGSRPAVRRRLTPGDFASKDGRGRIHINRVPQHNDIDDQAQCTAHHRR